MIQINIKFTVKELELLASLASDQLFRREFIDPKMPGQKANPAEISLGKDLVNRLNAMREASTERRTMTIRKLHAL